ncbi:zinc-ribbon domain-containing protein [Paenibacillus gansuensis]|uniref:DNA-directed RNA polymerase subunit alpha C-terminal domain-containing protein n=1 Tax=Paenibacillus gansuensis TaxID=306542 RepID=A0ABW5PHG6_9BACL
MDDLELAMLRKKYANIPTEISHFQKVSDDPVAMRYWDSTKNICGPNEVKLATKNPVWWKCPKHHSFSLTYRNFYNRKNKCLDCTVKVSKPKISMEERYNVAIFSKHENETVRGFLGIQGHYSQDKIKDLIDDQRAVNSLLRNDIKNLEDLLNVRIEVLLRTRNLGTKTLGKILKILYEHLT